MFGFLLVLGLGAAAVAYRQSPEDIAGDLPAKLSSKLDKLWEIAQESLKAQKYLRAEKALLTILRILYAKQHAYDDAIECFEIAQSLEPSASSLHNVGLIYYETESYEKAALAFEQALEMEEEVASRHIAYAKVQEKLGNAKLVLQDLERAVTLEPSIQSINILADSYDRNGQKEKAAAIRDKINRAMSRGQHVDRRVKQPAGAISPQ